MHEILAVNAQDPWPFYTDRPPPPSSCLWGILTRGKIAWNPLHLLLPPTSHPLFLLDFLAKAWILDGMPNFGHRHSCGHSLFPSIWVEFAAHIYAMSYSFTHIRMSNLTSENPKIRLQRCMIMAPLSTRNFGKCPQSLIWKTSPGHSISK